jgi:hypothetical protein
VADENRESGEIRVGARIEWKIPEGMVAKYATHFVVQHSDQEFILSFFELQPPIILGPREEVETRAKEVTSVPAWCVARVTVTPARLEEIISVLQENLATYKARGQRQE